MPAPGFLTRLVASVPLRLALLAFVVYNVNFKSEGSFDVYATRYIPLSLVTEGNLNLDEFPALHHYPGPVVGTAIDEVPYYLQRTRGHYISSYPAMPGILSAPIYAIPVWLLSALHKPIAPFIVKLLAKISASAAVAASVALIYLALLRMGGNRRRALWIALVYAFATSSWSNSSQGLWQTAWSQPLLALVFYLLLRADEGTGYLVGAGTALGLSVACRPPNIIIAVALSLFVFHRYRSRIVPFAVFPVIIGGLLAAYNLYWFATPVGGYQGLNNVESFVSPFYPRWGAFWGLLISPSRGMLVHSPVLLFAFAGLGVALREPKRHLLLAYTAVATLLMIVFYSTWNIWWAGDSFSYRFLVDLLPGLCLMLALVWDWMAAHRAVWQAFLVAAAFSVAVQIVGVVFYPCEWAGTPERIALARGRLWDWKDPQVLRCLRAGPHLPWQGE